MKKEKLNTINNCEFLDGQFSKIHRSVASGRQDQKYLLEKTENLLVKHLNPIILI
jgi:hypothetical protein